MGVYSVLQHKMKCFVVLSAVVACGFAAPVAEADADAGLIAGTYGHGLLGHGLVGGVYAAGHAVAAPAVATVAHAAPAVATYAAAAPAVATVAAPVAVATAPVVQHVGYNVHHQVHHFPKCPSRDTHLPTPPTMS